MKGCVFALAAAGVFLILTLKCSDCKEAMYFLLLYCSFMLSLRKRLKTWVCFFSNSLSSCKCFHLKLQVKKM